MISHIAALSSNRVIGDQGRLPWHLSEDLKYFKEQTKNKCIIMGRKTYESLGKPLPHRYNVVVTRNKDYQAPGCVVFTDIQEAIEHCKKQSATYGDEIMIIGGAEIYKLSLPFTDRLYLTEIDKVVQGDAVYPEYHQSFKLVEKRDSLQDGLKYSFCIYEKTNQ